MLITLMRTFYGYNILDIILIALGLSAVISTSIIFDSTWYVILQCVLCLLTVFTQAKGKVIT